MRQLRITPMHCVAFGLLVCLNGQAAAQPDDLRRPPPRLADLSCTAEQTGGFHDYPGDTERYEAALFQPGVFKLQQNHFFTDNLAPTTQGVDLYLTLINADASQSELECRSVRGSAESTGYSCVNAPPSQMLLINAQTYRFTRTAVGGWTFTGAADQHNGDSIFVEFGTCVEQVQTE